MKTVPAQADVVIVGAGVMGCSLAFHLSSLGAGRIIVLERGAIGQGATAACAGGVRAQFSTEINIRMGIEAKRMLAGFERETGRSADFRPVGYLFLLTTEEERALFASNVRLQRRLGVDDVRELRPADARALVPGLRTDDLSGATFCPSDGLAGPSEVTFGYAEAARRQGVLVVEACPVDTFLCRGAMVEGVVTSRGEVRSLRTVLCTGPWAGIVGAAAGVHIPVQPSRRHVFVAEPFAGINRKTPMVIDFHTSFYFHPEGDGALFGMGDPNEVPGFSTAVDWTFLDRVSAVAARRWPPLLEARIKKAWAGLYELTPDSQPLVGPVPGRDGLWVAAGFSGHGFMMAPVLGKWLAMWMVNGAQPVDLAAFAPDRFERGSIQPERNVV